MTKNSGYSHSMVSSSGHQNMAGYSLPHPPFLKIQTSSLLLVPEWTTDSIYGLTGAMIAAVVASVTYECLSEYLQYLKRNALTKQNGPKCCGSNVITFGEKLGQSVIHILRVVFTYFLMFCVMTMNIWLLVAVVVGAAVGYGVGKPLVANRIQDTITSHGYDSVPVQIHRRRNKSERSRSWRYQPIVRSERDSIARLTRAHESFFDDSEVLDCQNNKNRNKGVDIVWLRRSNDDLLSRQSELSDVFDDSCVQLRTPSDAGNFDSHFDSIRSEGRQSSRSAGRFKSTSKVINDSFRSYRSDTEMRVHNTSGSNSFNQSFDSQTLDFTEQRHKSPKTRPVDRTVSAASTSSRFKPVSREIMRQMSFNDDIC